MFCKKLGALDILYSGKCNMACTYCYIHKDKNKMEDYNSKIRNSILSGDFSNKIIEIFADNKEQIGTVSLWGAEPTINADVFEPFIIPLFNYFPNLSKIMFSTNALLGLPAIKYFIDVMDEYSKKNNRKMFLEIQLSLDGPDYINDFSRHRGATNNTIKVAKEIIEYVNNCNSNFSLSIHTKATLTTEWFKYLIDINKCYEYFDFFEKVQDDCLKLSTNKNIHIAMATLPTIVNPGEHTKEDGLIFAEWVKTIRKIDVSRYKYYKHPLYGRRTDVYDSYMKAMAHDPFIPPRYTCSAGAGALSIDYLGNIMTCHKLHDNLMMGDSFKNWQFIKNTTIKYEEIEKEEPRLTYLNDMFHDSAEANYRIFKTLMGGLYYVGELDFDLTDDSYIKWLFCLVDSSCCHVGQGDETGSYFLPTMSYINLFAYGAAKELLEYYRENEVS
jgi:sulfatase maturation enzyme AslB (radical SAM superfamily)